jgi:hypothetical protein
MLVEPCQHAKSHCEQLPELDLKYTYTEYRAEQTYVLPLCLREPECVYLFACLKVICANAKLVDEFINKLKEKIRREVLALNSVHKHRPYLLI